MEKVVLEISKQYFILYGKGALWGSRVLIVLSNLFQFCKANLCHNIANPDEM